MDYSLALASLYNVLFFIENYEQILRVLSMSCFVLRSETDSRTWWYGCAIDLSAK